MKSRSSKSRVIIEAVIEEVSYLGVEIVRSGLVLREKGIVRLFEGDLENFWLVRKL